ncbi:MAG: PqqD family protein [Ruminococcus sp.]|nr:PqqD family protein [Ruminococcus sp.]
MKLKEGFITHTIQDTQMMVAAGEAAKSFHGLIRSNETAAFIVDCLKTDTTEDAIVDSLLAEYDVSREIAVQDVRDILEKLHGIGAIV